MSISNEFTWKCNVLITEPGSISQPISGIGR